MEQLPSTSSRSKVSAVARAQRLVERGGVGDGIGGDDAQHGRQRRRQHACALGHAADGPLVGVVQRNLFGHGVGGHDGAARRPRRRSDPPAISCTTSVTPASTLSIGSRSPIRPVEHTATSMAPVSVPQSDSAAATASAVAWVSWKPSGPVHALAPPELRIDRAQPPGGEHLLGPQHRCGLDLVAGEHARGGVVGALVEHQRQIGRAGRLDARGDAGGAEARGRGDALGAHQPAVSLRRRSRRHSHDRKAFGLGPAQRQVHRLHRRTAGALDEVVDGGDGDERLGVLRPPRRPAARRCCRSPLRSWAAGPRAAGARTAQRRRPFRMPRAISDSGAAVRAVQVARIPREVGISTGVKDTVTSLSVTAFRPCAISGVCRCLPADVVGARRSDDLGTEQVGLGGPARAGGAADGDDGDGGLDEIVGDRGQQREQRGSRVAAGDGDPRCAAQPVAGARAVRAARRASCPRGPSRRNAPTRRTSVSRKSAPQSTMRVSASEFLGQRRRVAMRQRQEDDVMAGQHVDVGGFQHPAGQRQQVRMVFGKRRPGAGRRGQRTDGQPAVGVGGVPEQQTQDLSARITTGTGDGHRSHAGNSAWLCTVLQMHYRCGFARLSTRKSGSCARTPSADAPSAIDSSQPTSRTRVPI